ncbi:MAG: AAA family ATPase [Thermodesulfobacteriota bacterium]
MNWPYARHISLCPPGSGQADGSCRRLAPSGKTTLAKAILAESYPAGRDLNWDFDEDRQDILRRRWQETASLLALDELHKLPRWQQSWLKGAYDVLGDRHSFKQFPVVLVTGARQVGKTTLLAHLGGVGRACVTLDDPLVRRLAKEDPALFLQRFPPPVLIDEIQYAPELLPYLKIVADRERQAGLFWLTGSQPFHLMRGVSESLAGRVALEPLFGLSRREAMGSGRGARPFLPGSQELASRLASGGHLPLLELYRLIWRGGFPRPSLDDGVDRDLFFNSYVQTYLQRDVRDLARVGNEMAFLRFLRAAASRTGQLLNLTELARDADVAVNTAKSWLSILEASGIVHLLEPYHTSISKRLVTAPKVYSLDTGLCSYLTEWSSPETLEAGAMSGAILETWVVAELLKSYWHCGRQPPFYHYRDRDKKEIDLLLVADGILLHPLEIKKTASPGRSDVRHFQVLSGLGLPVGPGGLICLAEQALPIFAEVWSIPVAAL